MSYSQDSGCCTVHPKLRPKLSLRKNTNMYNLSMPFGTFYMLHPPRAAFMDNFMLPVRNGLIQDFYQSALPWAAMAENTLIRFSQPVIPRNKKCISFTYRTMPRPHFFYYHNMYLFIPVFHCTVRAANFPNGS